jgi:hypothetical protein
LYWQAVILLYQSWFHPWKQKDEQDGCGRKEGKEGRDNESHLSCYITVETDEKAFWDFSKILGGKILYEIWCASLSLEAISQTLQKLKKIEYKLWNLILSLKEQ